MRGFLRVGNDMVARTPSSAPRRAGSPALMRSGSRESCAAQSCRLPRKSGLPRGDGWVVGAYIETEPGESGGERGEAAETAIPPSRDLRRRESPGSCFIRHLGRPSRSKREI